MADLSGISLIDVSAIVAGLVLEHKLAPNAVRTEILFPPYDNIIKLFKKNLSSEEIIEKSGLSAYQSALDAMHTLNGTANLDWVAILESKARKYQIGVRLEKLARRLQEGKEVDETEIKHVISQFNKGTTGGVPLSQIESTEVPRMKSGYLPIDHHLGGYPTSGLIVVGGGSGIGKTTWTRDIAKCFVREHTDKIVAVYSLEMQQEEMAGRFRESGRMEKEYEDRIIINCEHLSANQVFSDAARYENLGLVIIDFADMLIEGEESPEKHGAIYRTCHYGAKDLHCPVILLGQFTKEFDKRGGIPRDYDIKYTSSAKQLAWMLLMLYRPEKDFNAEKDATLLPMQAGIGYIVCWKVRGKIVGHPEDQAGAIQVRFDGEKGWERSQGKWFSLTGKA